MNNAFEQLVKQVEYTSRNTVPQFGMKPDEIMKMLGDLTLSTGYSYLSDDLYNQYIKNEIKKCDHNLKTMENVNLEELGLDKKTLKEEVLKSLKRKADLTFDKQKIRENSVIRYA